MFEGPRFPKSLSEDTFTDWLEAGRESPISYAYMLVVWDELDADYKPVYVEDRDKIAEYEKFQTATGRESLVAAYDLYSESRIS